MDRELKKFLMEVKGRKYNWISDLIERVLSTSNINLEDTNGCTLLYYDNRERDYEFVSLLCQNKANLNIKYSMLGFETILMKNVRDNNLKFVKLLLFYGVNINVKNLEGKSATDISKQAGFKEITDYLLKYEDEMGSIIIGNSIKCILKKLINATTCEEIEEIIEEATLLINNSLVYTEEMAHLIETLVAVKNNLGLISHNSVEAIKKNCLKK